MKGYVYILSNSSMPGMVKIGMTFNSPHHRAAQLSTTGVPKPFKVFGFVEAEDPKHVEKRIHSKLYKYRVSNKREFFIIDPNSALKLLEEISGEVEVMRQKRARRLEQEKLQIEEMERKNALGKKMNSEYRKHLTELSKNSYGDTLSIISEYAGKGGWIVFWIAMFLFYSDRDKAGIITFTISLAIGCVSILLDYVDDKIDKKYHLAAKHRMNMIYGEGWDNNITISSYNDLDGESILSLCTDLEGNSILKDDK